MGVEETERKVIERARNGDKAAAKQIFETYSNYLAATCARYLPDPSDQKDVLQESFVRIFTSLDKFDFKGEGSLKAWMRQILVNEALKLLRKRRRNPFVKLEFDLPDERGGPEEEPDVGDVPRQVIQKMVMDLPEGYRTVLNLFVFEEKSHREISRLLGISESTSASQLYRARMLLVKKINDYIKTVKKP